MASRVQERAMSGEGEELGEEQARELQGQGIKGEERVLYPQETSKDIDSFSGG